MMNALSCTLFCTLNFALSGALFLAYEAAGFALFYTVFCHCTRSDHTTHAGKRLALLLLGSMACLGIVAPLLWAEAL